MTQPYDTAPGIRWSHLSAVLDSPLHLRHRIATERTDTAPMRLGRAIHAAVLEPDLFDASAHVVPEGYVTATGGLSTAKAVREWVESLGDDPLIVTPAEREACLRIRDAVQAHEDGRVWLREATVRERPVYWTDDSTGIACKAKPDAVCPRLGLLWDLKTTASRGGALSLDGIVRTIAQYRYHGQLAYYSRGLAQTGMPVEAFGWIFVESAAPYDVAVVQADDAMVAAGWAMAEQALSRYCEAEARQEWPGVAPRLTVVSLPRWASVEV